LGNVMTPPCSGLKLRMPLMSSLRRAARKPRQLSATQRSQRAPRRARGRAAVKRAGSPQRRAHERGEAAAQLVHKAAKPRTCQPWPSCGGWQPPRGPRLSGGARRQYQPGDTLQPEALRSVKRLKRALGRARTCGRGGAASQRDAWHPVNTYSRSSRAQALAPFAAPCEASVLVQKPWCHLVARHGARLRRRASRLS
jgi:hypothetical protein